jgi:hypothetical protein
MPAAAIRHLYLHAVSGALKPGETERLKLDRLRELRAAIDALRQEKTTNDPLLAWVVEQENQSAFRQPD